MQHYQRVSAENISNDSQHHHFQLTVAPGKPEQLYVGTLKAEEPAPKFDILCHPDDDSLACQPIAIDQEDGRTQHYYYFENFGMAAVEVKMQRIA